mgnify:FL=1
MSRASVQRGLKRFATRMARWSDMYLNYFRVHMMYFIVMIMFWSAIMYASNPKDHYIPYIDCLFMCASAMTVTGLVSVPVSDLTLWQQIILFCLMCCGNLIMVSTTTVLVRRHWFRAKFRRELERSFTLRKRVEDVHAREQQELQDDIKRIRRFFHFPTTSHPDPANATSRKPTQKPKLHAGMIQRVQGPAVQVNPTGQHTTMVSNPEPDSILQEHRSSADASVRIADQPPSSRDKAKLRRLSFGDAPLRRPSDLWHTNLNLKPTHTVAPTMGRHDSMTHAIPLTHARTWQIGADSAPDTELDEPEPESTDFAKLPGQALHRTMTKKRDTGLGGFPSVFDFALSLVEMTSLHHRTRMPAARTMTMSRPLTDNDKDTTTKFAPYLTFDALVTGNSHFRNLTSAQRRELGGVEYRALTLLSWLIPIYWFACVAIVIVLTAPYLASGPAAQYRVVLADQPKPPRNSTWFWIFQTVSSMTNAGMSLCDSSLSNPLRQSYMMLVPQMILIIIGNTGFPIMLRFVIWFMSRCVSKQSRTYETLSFLLDHPRRCYLYLFPSHNTWFLLFVLFILTVSDWFLLMICDLATRHAFPSNGTWIFSSLFQSVSTRSSGFQTFDILSLTASERLLEVVMMYIAAFPLMMTMRSTNVYEDRSLFVEEPSEQSDESESQAVWGRFIGTHIRNQLAYDLWWVMLALWIVLLCEKNKVESEEYKTMSVFGVIFELVSAYGTVGMSFGATKKSASLVGDMSVLSKLVIVAVIIRGRHRNLPSAVDRAVMLPHYMEHHDEVQDQTIPPRSSMSLPPEDAVPRSSSRASHDPTIRRRTMSRTHTRFADDPVVDHSSLSFQPPPRVESPSSML